MNNFDYSLPIPENGRRQLAKGWLILGLAALLGSGIFSVLLVLARTPYVQNFFPWVDFFHTALVVHVDLSVLVWFLPRRRAVSSIPRHAFSPVGWRCCLPPGTPGDRGRALSGAGEAL
jgi:hypothetical protein